MSDKKKKVISQNNIAIKFPLSFFLLVYLVMDKYGVPEWGWGVFWTIVVFAALVVIFSRGREERVDIFSPTPKKAKEAGEDLVDQFMRRITDK